MSTELILATKQTAIVRLMEKDSAFCDFCGENKRVIRNDIEHLNEVIEERETRHPADICEECARKILSFFEDNKPFPDQNIKLNYGKVEPEEDTNVPF